MEENIANQIIQAARNAGAAATSEETSFHQIVGATRSLFRRMPVDRLRQPHSSSSSPKRRGRKPSQSYKKKVFIVKLAHSDFLPSANEQKFLARRGLGLLTQQVVLKRKWSSERVKEEVLKLLPPHIRNLLQMADFNLASCGKQRFLKRIAANTSDVEKALGHGMLIVIPKTDFPNDLPIILEGESNYGSRSPEEDIENSDSDFEEVYNSRSVRNSPQPIVNAQITDRSSGSLPIRTVTRSNQNETLENQVNALIADTELNSPPEWVVNDNDKEFLNFPLISESADMILFNVERDKIVMEVFEQYQNNESITERRLSVRFIGEDGIDGGGLLNELFTIFWREIFRGGDYFIGADVVVPNVNLDMSKELKPKFLTLGKVLGHMILLTGKMPHRLAVYTMTALSNKQCDYSEQEELLLHDFLLFVTLPERKLINKALSQFEKCTENEYSRLVSFYMAYGLRRVLPNKHDFKKHLVLLAENTLLKNTAELYQKMKEGMPKDVTDYFTNIPIEDTFKIWKSLQATPEKVANILKLQPLFPTNDEDKIFYYLQNYVLGLNADQLNNFLLFVTASLQMPETILIDFHNGVGIARRPIASTCSNLLQLCIGYDNQHEFNAEMDNILNSDMSYVYNTF